MKDRHSVIFVAGLLLLAVLACGELRKKSAVRESTPDFEISADQLAKEFKENPATADMKYTGRTLAITGRVDGKILGSSLVFEGHARHGFATQCFFAKDDTDAHKKIEKGKDVTVLGVCMGRDTNDGPLMIAQCIFR
jgi:hypothetical protein